MNRTVLAAGAVVLLSNGVALFQAARNRWGEPETTVEVTERELRLNWMREGNSHRYVTFNWTNLHPDWLGQDKLASLGFDVSSPSVHPRLVVRPAYVAFEMDGPAWQKWEGSRMHEETPRLVAIDVDRDPVRLRGRNPDRTKVLILRATVRAHPCGRSLCGSVTSLLSQNISVPPGMMEGIGPVWPAGAPRFAMRIAVGRNYEPYIAGFRRLATP
jgi:hypothetical protein